MLPRKSLPQVWPHLESSHPGEQSQIFAVVVTEAANQVINPSSENQEAQ